MEKNLRLEVSIDTSPEFKELQAWIDAYQASQELLRLQERKLQLIDKALDIVGRIGSKDDGTMA